MRYVVPYNNGNKPIPLGRAGENEYTEIAFDISAWQREFTINSINLLIQRPTDGEAYPADVTIEGVYAVHTLTSADLAYPGIGKCQLQMLSGTVIAKTRIYSTLCNCSLDVSGGDAPTPWAGVVWAQQNNQGAYLPTDAPGQTELGLSTVLIGTRGFSLSMIDDKRADSSRSNLVILPGLKIVKIQSAAAGSTSYTTTGNTWSDLFDGDVSYLLNFKYCDSNVQGGIAAYPTSVVQNDDDTVTLTFAESLNPDSATDRLSTGITLGENSRGTIALGNGVYNNSYKALLVGDCIVNSGQSNISEGQNVITSGSYSIVGGIGQRNSGNSSIVVGRDSKNTQMDSAVFGRGHNTTGTNRGIAVTGTYSDLDSDTLFAVGNGTDDDNRSNAMEVTTVGEILEGGTKLADKYQAKVIPDAPSADGNYVFKCTVSGGVPTYAWVAE